MSGSKPMRCSYAQRSILHEIRGWANERPVTYGFIVGQHFGGNDYIASCIPSNQYDENEAEAIEEISESSFTDHATRVTYMLPGGLWILGVFVVCDHYVHRKESEMDKLRGLLVQVKTRLSQDTHLHGIPPCENYLLFSYSSSAGHFRCKELDVNLSEPAQSSAWFFILAIDAWCAGTYMWNCLRPFEFAEVTSSPGATDGTTLSGPAVEGRMGAFRDLVENCSWTLNRNKKADPEDKIHSHTMITKNPHNEPERLFHVNIYMANDPPGLEYSCDGDEGVSGESTASKFLTNKVYVHRDATVRDAVRAIQDDLSRTWSSKLQICMENCTKGISNFTLWPRRVLLRSKNSKIYYSHYLFPEVTMFEPETKMYLRKVLGMDLEECLTFDPHENLTSQGTKSLCNDETDIQNEEEYEESKIFLITLSLLVLFSSLLYVAIIEK